MKKARFTESQIVAIFKEADVGLPVGEVIRKHGISRPLLFKAMGTPPATESS